MLNTKINIFILAILYCYTSLLNAAESCTVDNNPDGCICTEESHPPHCKIDIPESEKEPWYEKVKNWVKENVDYSKTSTGWSGEWKYLCGETACVHSLDSEGNSRDIFYINENITFDIASSGLETTVTDDAYGWNNYVLTENGGWLYKIGWAYHGTYLDDSCHAKLAFWQSNWSDGPHTNWYWTEEAGCNSNGFKGYYGGPGYTQTTTYSYDSPGIYWIGAIPLVYHGNTPGFRDAADVRVQAGYKRVVVVDENGCIFGQCLSEAEIIYGYTGLAWLAPVISLILN